MKYNLVKAIEIDKFSCLSYNAIFGTNIIPTDICKMEKLPKCDLVTYGFPCQDISIAGKGTGIKVGTRSGLLLEVERLLGNAEYKPKFLLMENVKQLVGEKHKNSFLRWCNKLKSLGYINEYNVLNAKDYNVPQSRERVFMISVRKDIYNGISILNIPKIPSEKVLKNALQLNVDRKYYLSEKMLNYIVSTNFKAGNRIANINKVADTLLVKGTVRVISTLDIKGRFGMNNRIYSNDGLAPTLNTAQGGGTVVKVKATTGYRYLTPLEYWRLMCFSDEDFYKAQNVNSNSQLYKQAGNSICVDVLQKIFENLKWVYYDDFIENIDIVTLFSGIGAFEKAIERIH